LGSVSGHEAYQAGGAQETVFRAGGGHRSELERRGQLQRVLDTRIIVRRGGGVEGDEEITSRYFENAKQDGLLPLAV